MNIALIIAGGVGKRMHMHVPKQFLKVNKKPVIVYTIEIFEKHPMIDAIEVVCLEGWENWLEECCETYEFSKVKGIITGGDTGQESICNGVDVLGKKYSDEDVILVHDAIRPLTSEDIITDCIQVCKDKGNAISAVDCTCAMLMTEDGSCSQQLVEREALKITQTPQATYLKTLVWAHEEAKIRNITGSVATCTLLIELGRKVYFSKGSEMNLKLTTKENLELFQAIVNQQSITSDGGCQNANEGYDII